MAVDVFLKNAGTDDFVLKLGHVLANGKVMRPDAMRVTLIRSAGRSL